MQILALYMLGSAYSLSRTLVYGCQSAAELQCNALGPRNAGPDLLGHELRASWWLWARASAGVAVGLTMGLGCWGWWKCGRRLAAYGTGAQDLNSQGHHRALTKDSLSVRRDGWWLWKAGWKSCGSCTRIPPRRLPQLMGGSVNLSACFQMCSSWSGSKAQLKNPWYMLVSEWVALAKEAGKDRRRYLVKERKRKQGTDTDYSKTEI